MEQEPISLDYPGISFDLSVFGRLLHAILSIFGVSLGDDSSFEGLVESLAFWWQIFSLFSFLLSGALLFGIVYAKIRYSQLAEIVHEQIHAEEHAYIHEHGGGDHGNDRWNNVLHHLESESPNDWRLAVIEADVLLEEALDGAGFVGQTIGEKLKDTNAQAFKSLQDAWEAHKIRNEIAHRGGDFILTKRIAQETIQRYQRVFTELGVI